MGKRKRKSRSKSGYTITLLDEYILSYPEWTTVVPRVNENGEIIYFVFDAKEVDISESTKENKANTKAPVKA
jgi:hypothetical protein